MTGDGSPRSLSVVILAAGAGTRMKSKLPKPLHQVGGRPMLAQVLDAAKPLDPVDITVVGSAALASRLSAEPWAGGIQIAIQEPPLGTADAARVALDAGAAGDIALILFADHPLVTTDVLQDITSSFDPVQARLAVMTCHVNDAAGYGRIARDDQGCIRAIVEAIDDDPAQRDGRTEINSGVMALDRSWAKNALAKIEPHAIKQEYFLTSLAQLAHDSEPGSVMSLPGTADLLVGINDRSELAVADALLRDRKRRWLMKAGVTLIAPETNLIDLDVEIGSDTIVGPYCVLESNSVIGEDCRIGPSSVIRQSRIGDRVRIESSTVEESTVRDDSDVGPYSHIRGGSEIGPRAHIGNFAELKNARLGEGVRVGHFSYIGDAALGEYVNIGAGTITCNFDGENKHHTNIGAGAFIGSDTLLIAPVSVGPGARTGAGAVVTRDVSAGATVVGMPARQVRRALDVTDSPEGEE